MAYVAIDTQGARALGQVLRETSALTDALRRDVIGALMLADLASQTPAQLGIVQDGFATLGAGVIEKADLAEQFVVDPQGTSARLGAPVDAAATVIAGLVGFAGPTDLRSVLVGLPAAGADPALDGALARLSPALLPAMLGGERPELDPGQLADLRVLALQLGIEHAGPPSNVRDADDDRGGGLFARMVRPVRGDSEVFWNDFWADGRAVADVLADPGHLYDWVTGTVELDRRLALAADLPRISDVLATAAFATSKRPGDLNEIIASAQAEFAAIERWLPAYLVGQNRTGPDAAQLAQTLAFAARVGWTDPGAVAADSAATTEGVAVVNGGTTVSGTVVTDAERFAAAVAFLRANRMLQSALLPTGFESDQDPLAFFNEAGIGHTLALGSRQGAIDSGYLGAIAGLVDQAFAGTGVNLSAAAPVELTEAVQQRLLAMVATQIPRSVLSSPAFQAQFVASLGYLRQATTGPQLQQRIIEVVAAFRTVAVVGAPALTEAQLAAVVGPKVLDVLGRARLRLRDSKAVQKSPEFLLVARQWGIPGSRKETIGKYKFTWSFNDLGELAAIRRKKKSSLSRVFDTIKSIGKAIVESWKDNPFKAIFQIGKLALGGLALVVPGFQGLGAAALAVNLADAAYHAIEGDWLSAIGAGLSAFTAGATDIFGSGVPTIVEAAQAAFVGDLLNPGTLSFLKDAKRIFDIGSSVFRATQADSIVAAIGAGLGAAATGLGSGSDLLGGPGGISAGLAQDLRRLGTTLADVTKFVTPAAGLVDSLDKGNVLASFSNGLSIVAAGSRLVANPRGAFGAPSSVTGTAFELDGQTQATLGAISRGTGVAASVTRAIDAASRGQTALAGTSLAQAVQLLNDPNTTVLGNRARVAEQIGEIGALLQAGVKGAPPELLAPLLMQRLTKVVDALNTPVVPPLPTRNPFRMVTNPAASSAPALAAPVGLGGGAPFDDVVPFAAPATASGGDTAFETFGADLLAGGAGNDVLAGGAGNELLAGGVGFDLLSGGVGAEALAGFSVSESPSAVAGSRELDGGKTVSIVVVGDSFGSGEGAGEGRYIEMGSPVGGTSLAHPVHQSPDAPAMRAIEALQGQYPEATIRVTYSANPTTVQTIPPLVPGGDGPLFDVKFVAESGATARSAMVSGMNSLLPAQVAAVDKDTDILIYSLGGNDAEFSAAIKSAVGKISFYNGVTDISGLAEAVPTHTMTVVDAIAAMVQDKNPNLQVIGVGYPNILTSLDQFGNLPPMVLTGKITDNIDPFENVELWNFGAQVDVLGNEAAQLAQQYLAPGQSLTFLPYWGTWGEGQTMFADWKGAVDFNFWGERFQESFHPSPDKYPDGVERVPYLDYAAMAELTDLKPGGQAFMAGPLVPALSGAVARTLGQPVVDAADPFATLAAGVAGIEPPSGTPVVTQEMAHTPYGVMEAGLAVSLPETDFDPFVAFGGAGWALPDDPSGWELPDLDSDYVVDSPGLSYSFDDGMEPYSDFGSAGSQSLPEYDAFEAFAPTPSYTDDSFSFDF